MKNITKELLSEFSIFSGLSLEQIKQSEMASPLGRIGKPEDAANAIYLMCIPESNWITGEVILASGGVRN